MSRANTPKRRKPCRGSRSNEAKTAAKNAIHKDAEDPASGEEGRVPISPEELHKEAKAPGSGGEGSAPAIPNTPPALTFRRCPPPPAKFMIVPGIPDIQKHNLVYTVDAWLDCEPQEYRIKLIDPDWEIWDEYIRAGQGCGESVG
ncbi:uncharacterized protein N7518_008895 [Penicillium psychrosexuale]|uniref:uncharacterized protein n=1 Tax=Penicillium psychrosexuale TaxID=1002107 RepID=UPI0025452C71|nr:uncharacterized protein N7518_008895 [Penicillium psychrosexuale]KAJ5791884.1 hypothetical protein N7518_008895 [Penicillium psychrosexuale]